NVDVGEAEVGKAADCLDLRRPEQGGHDGVGDLVLDDVRAAVPARIDDDLRVREVGDGIQGHVLHEVESKGDRHQGKDQDEVLVPGTEFDDAFDHDKSGVAEFLRIRLPH